MRWFVEISPLGAKSAPSTTLCVDAPQWKHALQKGRALRGDDGPLSGFSIELLDEGFRAIDPNARLRYEVRRAPDDAAVTTSVPPPVTAAAPEPEKPAPAPEPAKRSLAETVAYTSTGAALVTEPEKPAAKLGPEPPKAAVVPAPDAKKNALAQTVAYSSTGAAAIREEPPAKAKPAPETPKPAPEAPKAAAKAAPEPAKAEAAKTEPAKAAAAAKAEPAKPEPAKAAPPKVEPAKTEPAKTEPAKPAAAKAADPVPSFVLVGSRDENPTESSPLTYRELVFAVAPGTPEDDARRLILDRFENVRATLDAGRMGKLINLAVFDHVFHGRPQRRPLVTLTWKDWKGDSPELSYPARDGEPGRATGSTPTPAPAKPAAAPAKAEPAKVEPAKADPPKAAPAKVEPAKPEPAKAEPAKAAPAKVEPAKPEPAKATPAKAEPAKPEPAKATPAKAEPAKAEPAKVEPAKPAVAVKAEPAKVEPAKPAVAVKAEPAKAEPAQPAGPVPVASTLNSAKSELLPKHSPEPEVPVIAAPQPVKVAEPAKAEPVKKVEVADDVIVAMPVKSIGDDPAESAAVTRPVPTIASPSTTADDDIPIETEMTEPPAKAEPAKPEPAKAQPAKAEPAKVEPAKAQPAKAEPAKVEPTKAQPAKPEPAKAEPAKAQPAKPEPAKAQPAAAARPAKPPVPTAKPGAKPAAAGPKKRLSGDDLIAELFEAFGDLHFVRDTLEGAEFVLSLAMEKMPSEVGLVSFFDMNKREFVIARQSGGPRSALCARQPERATLAFSAMRRRHAIVVSDKEGAAKAMDERFRSVGVEIKSLICAPVELGGRFLGLIEIANPLDGSLFNEGDGNALTYIGGQFAEFVAERGVVVDPAQIMEPKPSNPPPPPTARTPGPPSSKKAR